MQLLDPGQVDFVLISHRLSRKFGTEQDRAQNANKQTNPPVKYFHPQRRPKCSTAMRHMAGHRGREKEPKMLFLKTPAKAGIT